MATLNNRLSASLIVAGVPVATFLFASKLITVLQVGGYFYPIFIPFDVVGSGTFAYYALLAYQVLSCYNVALNHVGSDCILFSIFASIIYQIRVIGYRYSRLGHSPEGRSNVRLDCMKNIVELIRVKFDTEK